MVSVHLNQIQTGINEVFKSEILLARAWQFYNQHSNDIGALVLKLNALCRCDFITQAGIGSYDLAQEINQSIEDKKEQTPDIITLIAKVGSSDLDTEAKNLSDGINELLLQINKLQLTNNVDLSNILESISNINALLENFTLSINNLNDDITSNSQEISQLQSLINLLNSTLIEDVSNIQDDITSNSQGISQLQSSINLLNSTLQSSITNNSQGITQLQSSINLLNNTLIEDVSNIQDDITSNSQGITQLQSLINLLNNTLIEDVSNIQDDITSNSQGISELGDLLNTLNSTNSNINSTLNTALETIGNSLLATTAQTLSAAVNELKYLIDNLYDIIGLTSFSSNTTRSFYSCSSLGDNNPILIGSTSNTLSGRASNDQKCNDWSYKMEWQLSGSLLIENADSSHVYVSTNSSGGCYDVVGKLMTKSTKAYMLQTNASFGFYNLIIDSLSVNYNGSAYNTEPYAVDYGNNLYFNLTTMAVLCKAATCSTPAIDITATKYEIQTSPAILTCNAFPCSVGIEHFVIGSIPARQIIKNGTSYYTNPLITLVTDNYRYFESQNATCSGSTCSIPAISSTPLYLMVPERAISCNGTSCDSVAPMYLLDSLGTNISVPTIYTSCDTSEHKCSSNQTYAIINHSYGQYKYFFPNQRVFCSGSSCVLHKIIIYSSSTFFNILEVPELIVGITSPNAGSLYTLCMHELEN